ncbi:MAG: hypothetical protein GC179_30275 [Anaerolineaceae bacterium]|nr:hypothetical protein [Anaerolineaceae bacterium]
MKDFNFEVWRLQAESDIKGLVAALQDPNPQKRRAAATALRALGSTTAIPGVQDALMQEGDPELREILVMTLEFLFAQNNGGQTAQTTDNRNIVRLIARLSGNHTEQAVRAAQELGDSREKLTIEALLLTFNNRKLAARVRLAVAEALLKLQSATSEISLLAALRSERWMIRRNAAAVLGQIEADWAVEPLLKALHDPIEAVRRVSRAALERIGTPEALAAINAPALPAEDDSIKAISVMMQPTPSTEKKPKPTASATEVAKPDASAPETPKPEPAVGLLSYLSSDTTKVAILDEPPPSEEDTKPLRPLPDDVS